MFIEIALIFGCSVIAILFLGQLFVSNKKPSNIVLILLLLACGFWAVQGTVYMLGAKDWFPHFNKTSMPFIALTGPMLYLYNLCLFENYDINKRSLVHLVPFILCFLLAVPFYNEDAAFKTKYMETYLFNSSTIMVYIGTRISELSAISYIFMTMLFLNRVKVSNSLSTDTKSMCEIMEKVVLFCLLAAICRSIGAILNVPLFSAAIPCLIILTAVVVIYISSQRNPKILALNFQVSNDTKANRRVDSTLLKEYEQNIIKHQLFLDSDLTISKLAKKLSVQPHTLSELINSTTHSNFKSFINSFRVKYAKHILLKYPQKKILDVAYGSGFNSKSVFYNNFTKMVGMTPTQFRKEELSHQATGSSTRDSGTPEAGSDQCITITF